MTTEEEDKTEDIVYDVPNYDIFEYSPRYPTLTPKTKCDNKKEWGTWILDRETSTQNIVKLQKECVDTNKNSPIDTETNIEAQDITTTDAEDFKPSSLTKPKS